jgi:UDP-GlcNAc:undecaprenyl-phosphate/decaprenyl-phosphate GlcNAc-1-phosphate transferase
MRTYFAILILSALASFLATPWARKIAEKLGAIDLPSDRKIHAHPTPRLGGIAVFIGFLAPLASFYLWQNRVTAIFRNYEKPVFALVLAGISMLVLGIYDDCRGADARKKFAVQIPAALFLYYFGFRVDILSNPFGQPIHLGWLGLPFSVLWILMITNAINLLDGIDGLVPGVTAVIALSLGIINVIYGNTIIAILTFSLAGACAGFLPHNFAPARIFLGDSGSLFVGMTLSGISMYSLFKGTTATLIAVPLVLFGLPLFDTASVMIGRIATGRPVFQADKSHIHHRLLQLGLSQRQAALFLYAVTILLGAISVTMSSDHGSRGELMQAASSIMLVLATSWLIWKMRVAREDRCSP